MASLRVTKVVHFEVRGTAPAAKTTSGTYVPQFLKLEPSYDLALTGRQVHDSRHCVWQDGSEATGCLPVGTDCLGRKSVHKRRIVRVRPVEDVCELSAQLESHVLAYPEVPGDAQVFLRAPLITVIAIVCRCGAELAGGGIRPCLWVQNECFVRVETMTIQILREQRHAGNAIYKCVLKRVSRKTAGRSGHLNREAASV